MGRIGYTPPAVTPGAEIDPDDFLLKANNLSDLPNKSTSRDNLELGSFALRNNSIKTTGQVASTWDRNGEISTSTTITSGQISGFIIELIKGRTISNITFLAGTTPTMVSATNCWFCIYDKNGNLVGVTADAGAAGWAVNTLRTLAMQTPFVVPATDYYYVGIMVAAGTTPGIAAVSHLNAVRLTAPFVSVRDSTHTGLTTPATAPAVATWEATSPHHLAAVICT